MSAMLIHVIRILCILLCCLGSDYAAEVYTLEVIVAPAGAVGGEIFSVQPQIAVVDSDGVLAVDLDGYVYAEMGNSPTGEESLYIGSCDLSGCGVEVYKDNAFAVLENGVAVFEDLQIRTAGSGYTLKFVAVTSTGIPFAFTFSETFDVEVGEAYSLDYIDYLGQVHGGLPFEIQPSVRIIDRGGNTINSINTGTVVVELVRQPEYVQTQLLPASNLNAAFEGGVATFSGLYINEAGTSYQMGFSTDMVLNGTNTVYSGNFTVAVGAPAMLTFVGDFAAEPIQSGEFFPNPPILQIRDAGGNMLVLDSWSKVRVSIEDNAANSVLAPVEHTTTIADRGVVRFSAIRLVGGYATDFRLKFSLYKFNAFTLKHDVTPVAEVVSGLFEVALGRPRKVSSVKPSDYSWAGNQPFDQQPVLALMDYSNNVIKVDSKSNMTANIVSSLSANFKRLVVDTSNANATEVLSVEVDLLNGTYGAGEQIDVYVEFEYEVWVSLFNVSLPLENSSLPYITLNINTTSGYATASLNTKFSYEKTRFLVFTYIVQPMDATLYELGPLNTSTAFVVVTSDTSIIDGNGNTVVGELPSSRPDFGKQIYIDTSTPYVVGLESDTSSGEYGSGEEIFIRVTYNFPVYVTGSPYLTLAITNKSNPVQDTTRDIPYYDLDDDDYSVLFLYTVGLEDDTVDLQLANSSIQVAYDNVSQILRRSTFPITPVNFTLSPQHISAFDSNYDIVIDTTAPRLNTTYGLQTTTQDGWYYPGDVIDLSISFDKEVALGPGISIALLLDVGGTKQVGSATITMLGSDNKTLYFEYVVTEGTNTSALDIFPIDTMAIHEFGDRNYIRRRSTIPTKDANLSTADIAIHHGNSLTGNHAIGVFGFPPVVTDVSAYALNSTGQSVITIYPGDTVWVNITFNAPVVATCDPVLVIQTTTTFRNAALVDGNETSRLTFAYIGELGDESPTGFYYRHLPNALCSEETCSANANPSCKIYAHSMDPSVEIKYIMPWRGRNKKLGMRVTSDIVISPSHSMGNERNTSVVSAAILHNDGEVGTGTPIYLSLTFTDDVFVTSKKPYLYLNTGRFVNYFGGSGTKTLSFLYYVNDGDDVNHLDVANVPGTSSTVACNNTCSLVNRLGEIVNTTTIGIAVSENVSIDTSQPVVVDVWSNSTTSPYDSWYAAGQSIFIFVEFDKPVYVTTDAIAPQLRMQLNTNENRYALFSRENSSDFVLAFELIVEYGDYTENLEYDGVDALVTPHALSKIFRAAPYVHTEVNYTLPAPVPLAPGGHTISINASTVPSVVEVTSTSPDGRYATGDVIDIYVHFTHYVVVEGNPYINLNFGDHVGRAYYSTRDGTDASKDILFQYTVASGDYSHDLDYVDVFSLRRAYTPVADLGSILQASTNPIVNSSLTLPKQGTEGSLSFNSDIIVDGRQPYMTSLSFVNPAETIYEVRDVIQIEMNFSAPVFVEGTPYIVLETGTHNRFAYYVSGTNSSSLLFEYAPQPGDMTNKLDYAFDRVAIRSCAESFNVRGEDGKGAILAHSENPTQEAHIHLNPLRGVLMGTTTVPALSGIYYYSNLTLNKQGPDYEIRYTSTPEAENHTVLSTTEPLFNSFSNEYELRPMAMESGDRVGWSVATDGEVSVLGAPFTNLIVKDVQTVTTGVSHGTKLSAVQEVQLLRVEVDRAPEIQSFYTTADVYQTVDGTFTINYGLLGPTRPIPANANAEMIEVALMTDIPKLGVVSVSRIPYIYCACYNAFTWNITFHDLDRGVVHPLVFDGSGLTGGGVAIHGPTTVQNSSYIGGTFTLLSDDDKETDPISFDVDDDGLIEALASIDIEAVEVQISPTNTAGSRTWTITFGAVNGSYEIPTLRSNASGITGGEATVWHTTARPGRHGPPTDDSISGISGYFMLEWRGNVTDKIMYNASADFMESALEALPNIEDVSVERMVSSDKVGYTWKITLNRVYYNTPRGYELDDHGPFDAIIAHNHLIGTNTSITIGSKSNSVVRLYGEEVRGLYGNQSGAVYVFQREIDDADCWIETSTITANDTDSSDQFGSSVSIYGDYIAIGAVGAETIGVPEIQSIFCSAEAGFFQLGFRGWTTSAIPHNVTRDDLIYAIQGDIGSMHSISIADWGVGGLCDNNTAVITFHSPTDGHAVMFGEDTGADLELLEVTAQSLTNSTGNAGTIEINEIQAGTRSAHGENADGLQTGSAYVFRAVADCYDYELVQFCNRKKWVQEAQFFPTEPLGHEKFGASISAYADRIAVGAPGTLGGEGAVYVYEYKYDIDSWFRVGKYTASVWVPELNDEFGYDVALLDDTLVVGTPGRNNNTGIVFIFRYARGVFVATQELYLPPDLYRTEEGDRFGCSVAIDGDLIVVGACGYDDSTIYLGQNPSKVEPDTGAAFVFRRESKATDFEFDQQLIPSNVRRLDRFGHDVSIHKNTIVVSAVENMLEGLVPSRPIMEVKTSADYNQEPCGNYFQLKWVSTNETGEWEQRTTRLIKKDASDLELRLILEEDLGTGPLSVVRSFKDIYDGGYVWTVTFLSESVNDVAPLEPVNDGTLTGTNAKVTVTVINDTPPIKRGNAHIFTRESPRDIDFEEQVYLFPFKYQRIDRCGWAVSIRDDYVLMGCPNRDFFIPNQNSGAGYMFKLDFLNLEFADFEPTVVEGNELGIEVVPNERESMVDDVLYFIATLDRNAFSRRQTLISNLYGLQKRKEVFEFGRTAVDISDTAGTAMARSQYYGSTQREHVWVDGVYDFRGLSDYVPIDVPRAYLLEYSNDTEYVTTTPDTILENLDETFTMILHAPGYWPSILGRLTSLATIEDDWDGYVDVNGTTYFQYDKLYGDVDVDGCEIGISMDIESDIDVVVSGCPRSTVDGVENAGSVFLYKQVLGHWARLATIVSPSPYEGGLFGDAVAIDTAYGRNTSTVVVGEPGIFAAHVFVSSHPNTNWTYDTNLTVDVELVVQHRFAVQGTLDLYGDIVLIGAPGIETMFLFTRRFDLNTSSWVWSSAKAIQSADYDYDLVFSTIFLHRQEFGTSVSISERTIAVGSPFADYDKIGSDNIEVDWFTEGTDIHGMSRGKVYLFTSEPAVQNITIYSYHQISVGTFKLSLSYRGITTNSSQIPFNETAESLKYILEELENIDLITTSKDEGRTHDFAQGDYGYYYSWQVTFLSEYQDPPLLVPQFNDTGCEDCERFDVNYDNSSFRIVVTQVRQYEDWKRSHELSARDQRRGDRFGTSVVVDGDTIAVGAVHSAAVVTTTWDFEAGVLQGWTTTGTAFDFQPTYGDNSYYHAIYREKTDNIYNKRGRPMRSQLRGRYYVGTYEKRPGDSTDYRAADPNYPQGNVQGDNPVGTMESQVFIIRGEKISFLVGGGCDSNLEYVELVVDGVSVARETGQCSESMRRVYFDVSLFHLRSAYIKVVDAGRGPWGHISVDDFRFDWDIKGGLVNDTMTGNVRDIFGGQVETSRSGAVHVFHRHNSQSADGMDVTSNCTGLKSDCIWSEVAKLTASDKRPSDRFGSSVALNEKSGVIAVGAPYTSLTGFYKETPSLHPHIEGDISTTYGLHFPVLSQNETLFMHRNTYTSQPSGSYGVMYLRNQSGIFPDVKAYEETGAVYVYTVRHAVIDHRDVISVSDNWKTTETAKIQPPDGFARDHFGISVVLSGSLLAIGSHGNDGQDLDTGAIYLYRAGFAAVSFSEAVFKVFESFDRQYVTVTILRDTSVYDDVLVLEYSTSDLTAEGVDSNKYEECLRLPPMQRGPAKCGDYEQTSGEMTIAAGDDRGTFTVGLVDDLCKEKFVEFIQVTISVPGSAALQGELMSAKIRIDDDDFFGEQYC